MTGFLIFAGAILFLVTLDEVAKRKWPEQRIEVLHYIGALYPVHRRSDK